MTAIFNNRTDLLFHIEISDNKSLPVGRFVPQSNKRRMKKEDNNITNVDSIVLLPALEILLGLEVLNLLVIHLVELEQLLQGGPQWQDTRVDDQVEHFPNAVVDLRWMSAAIITVRERQRSEIRKGDSTSSC